MNSLLFDYILNYLTPKEYRLELKNRLENLCSLSGQTMSPGLTKWLEKTFGIEMVRVIQDYANLGGNKFPPDYLEKINRLVPGNYKGYNVNMGFRQLFDVNCCDNFRYAIIGNYNGTAFDFTGWTINGLQFDLNYLTEFASAGCYTNNPYTNVNQLFNPHEIIVWYYGTNDPVFNILNDISDPVVLNWKSLCTKTCYETIVPQTDTVITTLVTMGPEFTSYIEPRHTFMALSPDVSIPADVAAIQSYYQQCCGASTTVTSVTNIDGDYVVRINNAYMPLPAQWSTSGSGDVFFYEITCP